MAKPRDYKHEYDTYHGKPEQIENRAARNKARAVMKKAGRVSKGDGKDVDHKQPLSKGGTSRSDNLRVTTVHDNRSYKRQKDRRPA